MDDKIFIQKEEFERLKASFDRLSEEVNLRKQAEGKLIIANNELAKHKQTEKKLSESETKFSTIFQQSPIALSIISLRNQILLDVNESFLQNVGCEREELVGQPANKLDLWVDHGKRDNFRQLMADHGKVENYEFEFQGKRGKHGYGLVSATTIEINNEPCVLSQIAIITDRKAVEEALKKSEARLNEAQHIAHIGSWELDIVNDILTWSDEIYRMFEIDPEKFGASYEAFLNAIHPDDRDLVNKAYSDSLRDKIPYDIVHRLQMSNGRIKYVNEKCETYYSEEGKPLRSVGTVHDISEVKLAEEAQRRLNRELQAISNCNQVLMRAEDEQTLLNDICQIICNEAGYRMAWVGFAEHDNAMSIRVVAHAGIEEGYLESANIIWADAERGHGPSGIAIRTGESACFQDFASDRMAAPWRDNALQRGYRSSIALPLKDENAKTFGVLNIYSAEPNAFTPDEIRLLEELAGDLAFGITVLQNRIERNQAEELIHKREAEFRTLAENIPDHIIRYDLNCRAIYVNHQKEQERYSVSSLIGKIPMDHEFAGPVELKNYQAKLQRVIKTGEPEEMEINLSEPTGINKVFEVHFLAERNTCGEIIGAMAIRHDITEIKRAAEEIRDLYNNAPCGYHSLNEDGVIVQINDTELNWLGYQRQEVIGKMNYIKLFTADSLKLFRKNFPKFKATGAIRDLEFELIRKDGSILPVMVSGTAIVDKDGNYLMSRSTVYDISERKLSLETLRESEEKYRTLIQKIQTAVVVHEADSQIITHNAKAQELLGLTADQLFGKKAIDPAWHFYREDGTIMPLEEYPVNLVMANHQELRNYIVGVHRLDNDVWVLVNADPVFGKEGEIAQVIVTFSDITELKQSEAERERINRALRMLSDINQALIHITDEPTLLNEVCRIIVDTGGYRLAWVGFAEHDEARTLRPVSHAGNDSGYMLSAKVSWADDERGQGPGGTAIRTGKPSMVRNIMSDPNFAPWCEAALQRGYKSIVALPLISGDNTLGALGIYSVREDAFDAKEVEILEELANDLAFGIMALRTQVKKVQAEESLAKSEDRFRRLAENARDVIYRMSLPEGKYEYISSAAYLMLGYHPEEYYNNPLLFKEAIHPDWHTYFEQQWTNLLKGAMPPTYEYQIVHKSGEVRWLNQRNILIRDNEGTPVAMEGIVTDITESKQAEELQEKERKRMEVLLSALNTGLSLINPDMTIAWVNQKIREMFPGREPVGQICHVFYQSRDTVCEGCGTQEAFVTGKVIESEQFVPSTGRWYYIISQPIIDTTKRVVNVLEGITDITERKQAEQKLKLLNFALNNVHDEAYLINEQGRFDYVNDESCMALGFSYEELLGMNVADVDPDFPLELWPQHWIDLREHNSIVFESHHKTRDGLIYPVEISANYFEYNDRGYNLALVRDITERKKAEEEIKKLNQELERRVAERTAQLEVANKELEAFSYSVSHDLRAPLRSIDGFSLILLEEYQNKLDEQAKSYLHRVRSASQRMAQLIDDMLNLSRVSRGELNIRQVNLSEIAKEVADEFYINQPERVVKFIIQEGIKAPGDSRLLRIVLENLIGNAWKFTSKHASARIEFGMQLQDDQPVYFIRDDGAGFDMNYAQKLFGAFQRLHNVDEFQGTGIGLATVQRVVHRHGGRVWAEGEVEKGATFYFTMTK